MRGESGSQPDAGSVAKLAERQHGVVSAGQLYSLGLSEDQVGQRVRAGWLHRVHRGVYAVGHRRLSRLGVWMAAVLAARVPRGRMAALSHRSAAELWGILRAAAPAPRPPEILIRARNPRPRPGMVVRSSTTLAREEVTSCDGIPCTTPARTLLDLAAVAGRRELERAMDEADYLRLCDARELAALAHRHRGRAGTALVAAVLDSHDVGSTLTRSELEERFLALCRDARLPAPRVNAPLAGLTVDFLWPGAGVVVEVDGRSAHATRRAFQDDRDRDSLLAARNYLPIRFTWWDVTRRPRVVMNRLRAVLRARS